MAVEVLTEIVLDRPCAVAAAYAGDPSLAPQWYVNIESVQWRTPEPVTVGSRMDSWRGFWAGGWPTPTRWWNSLPVSGW